MENYIVRIYRREKDNSRVLVGLVEEVGKEGKRAFYDVDDLWEILNSAKRAQSGRRERTAGMKKAVQNGEDEK